MIPSPTRRGQPLTTASSPYIQLRIYNFIRPRAGHGTRRRSAAICPAAGSAPLTGLPVARELGAREKREAGAGTPAPLVIARDGLGPLQTARDPGAPQLSREAAPPTTPHQTHEVSPWKV